MPDNIVEITLGYYATPEGNAVMSQRQHSFMREKFFSSNLISFYDKLI